MSLSTFTFCIGFVWPVWPFCQNPHGFVWPESSVASFNQFAPRKRGGWLGMAPAPRARADPTRAGRASAPEPCSVRNCGEWAFLFELRNVVKREFVPQSQKAHWVPPFARVKRGSRLGRTRARALVGVPDRVLLEVVFYPISQLCSRSVTFRLDF